MLLIGFTVALAIQSHRVAVERDRAILEAKRVSLEADGFYAAFREDYPRAAALLRMALALHRRALGNDNMELVPHLYKLGGYLDLFGESGILGGSRKDGAEITGLYREALKIRKRHLPPDHPLVIESTLILANSIVDRSEFDQKDLENAEFLYRDVIRARIRFGEGDSLRKEAMQRLAKSLGEWSGQLDKPGGSEKAEPYLRESLALVRATDGSPQQLMVAEAFLGECLVRLRRFAEAESLFQSSFELSRSLPQPPLRPLERAALERFVELYDASGQREKARHYRAKLTAMPMRESDLPKSH